jgi:mono/diheme cytochrome c family protein
VRRLALGLVLVAAGCGGGTTEAQRGHAVFEHACASCHTIGGRERGTSGGDLALGHLSLADIESFTRAMPTRERLSEAEVRAVSLYVQSRQR